MLEGSSPKQIDVTKAKANKPQSLELFWIWHFWLEMVSDFPACINILQACSLIIELTLSYRLSNDFTSPRTHPIVLRQTQCAPEFTIWTNSVVAGVTSSPEKIGSCSPPTNGNWQCSRACPA